MPYPENSDFHRGDFHLTYLLLPQLSLLTKMTVCSFAVQSFPAIDFSLMLLSAIRQPQHEKSCFSSLMSFILNTFLAQQKYLVTVSISVLRILQHSKMLLLQIIPCHITHKTARQRASKQNQKLQISINTKGNIGTQTGDSFSGNTESKFCLTIN